MEIMYLMNEKTNCCKKNTASQRHPRSSILNNIFAYPGELQRRENLNADQAKKYFPFIAYLYTVSARPHFYVFNNPCIDAMEMLFYIYMAFEH